MIKSQEHAERAAYCGCIDGRDQLTDSMLAYYDDLRRQYGQVFRFFWGGGPLLFILPEWQDFDVRQLKLAHKVHPLGSFYGHLHMMCGGYGALAGQVFETRDQELGAKWADTDKIAAVIEGLDLGITAHVGIIDVDGTLLGRP